MTEPARPGGQQATPVLAITGPSGVGKTTIAHGASRLLEQAGMGHALIDTDELDRIFPAPVDDPRKTRLTARNLAAVWANYNAVGATRLLLVGVWPDPETGLATLPPALGAAVTVVRLMASDAVLEERVRHREVAGGVQAQLLRSRAVAAISTAPGVHEIATDGRTVWDIAGEILRTAGWMP